MDELQLRLALRAGFLGVTLVICLLLILFPSQVVAVILFGAGIMTVFSYTTVCLLYRFLPSWFSDR